MKREFRIKTADISNLTLSDIMAEIDRMNLDVPPGIGFDVEAAANQIFYNDEDYVIEYDDGKTEPDVSKMTRQELIDLAIQIEGGDTGRTFEESATVYALMGKAEISNLFTAMSNRWCDLEKESHMEIKPVTITDLEFHTLVTDGTDYAVVEITTETEMGKYYAHVEPEFIDDSETAILVSDMDTDYFEK